MWRITREITDEMTKNLTQRASEQIPATISRKMKFENGQQGILHGKNQEQDK